MDYHHLGQEFNAIFTQQWTTVNNINIHYVTGGEGEPVVLLHGYPQTWYAYRHIMLALANHFKVIVPDLRGLGDSDKPASGYDIYTVANDIYLLIQQLGYKSIRLLGHDFGANVAYAYAASHREEVSRLAFLDVGLLGEQIANRPLLPRNSKSLWWFPFHMVSELPELLVQGREEIYLNWFYQQTTFNKAAIDETALKEYVRCYASPGGMKAGFDYYRSLFLDFELNAEQVKVKLKMPVLALGGALSFAMLPYESWKMVCENCKGGVIENSGHYIAEEQPQLLLEQLLPFFTDAGQ